MRLDRLRAQEQLGRDLRIGLTVAHQAGDLELASRERVDPIAAVPRSPPRPPVRPKAEAAELALGGVALCRRAARLEFRGRALELGGRVLTVAGLAQRASRQDSRQRALDYGADSVGGGRRGQRSRGRGRRIPAVERYGSNGAIRHRAREAQVKRVGHRLGAGGRVRRLVAAARVQPAARQELEVVDSPGPGDLRELVAAR